MSSRDATALVLIGLVLLVGMLVSQIFPDAKPTVTGPPWEKRVETARNLLKYRLTIAGVGEEYYQEAERLLATAGLRAAASIQIEHACVYGHWRALLHLAVLRAIAKKPDEAMKAFDKAVLMVNPAGIEPDDFRPKMVGMAMVWLEVYPWWAESWEWHVGWEHRGLSGPQLRAKTIEAIIETIPPLKP